MKVLILNCGSSTLKFQVIETDGSAETRKLARGIVDRIGGSAAYSFKADGGALEEKALPVANHEVAVRLVIDWLGRRCVLLPYAQISRRLPGCARWRGSSGDFQWRYRRERAAGAAADSQRHGVVRNKLGRCRE